MVPGQTGEDGFCWHIWKAGLIMHCRERAESNANRCASGGKSILGHDDSMHDVEYMWLWGIMI